jgi:hypothetical protein
MDVGLRPWGEAVQAARVEVGQPTPIRNVTWEKGSASCAW